MSLVRMQKKEHCPDCNNTGIDINNNPCKCKFRVQTFYDTVSCMDIPEQYRGILFDRFLLPRDVPEAYGEYMQKLHDNIINDRVRAHNYCICSPIAHGKTIMAYSCTEQLFRTGVPTFPVFDILELKRILLDTDLCRKPLYEVEHPENMLNAGYVFIKIPRVMTWEVFDTMTTVLNRRVRRGNSTIFLYDGTWEQLTLHDKYGVFTALRGDGTYNTVEVSNWYITTETTIPDVQLEENIG